MSLPSDNGDLKKEDETFSNKDCSSDESEDIGQASAKKRKTKTAHKPAGALETSPGSDNSKSGKVSEDAELSEENSGSGDKNVGDVREDIEQLKLTEERAKDSKTKVLESSTRFRTNLDTSLSSLPGPCAQLQANPSTSFQSQPVPSDINRSIEEIQPPTEDVIKAKTNDPDVYDEECDPLIKPSSESCDTEEKSPDLNKTCSIKADQKRITFARNTNNTLDDVADIAPDSADSRTDPSSGRRETFHLAREDTPQDDTEESLNPSDETEESSNSTSEFASVKSIMEGNKAKGDSTSESNSGDRSGTSSQDNVYEKLDQSLSDSMDKEHVSDDKQNLISGSDMEASVEEVADKNGSSDMQKNADEVEQEREAVLEEPAVHEEMDDSISDQDNSGAQGGSDELQSGNEQISDQDGSGQQGTSDDQNSGNDQMSDQNGSGQQGTSDDQRNVVEAPEGEESSEQEHSNEYQAENASTTPDSGIDNSDGVFEHLNQPNELNQPEVQVQAEAPSASEDSSLASADMAQLNDLQAWVVAGERGIAPQPVPLAAPNQPVQANEEPNLNVPSNAMVQPSTSSDWPGQGVVYLAKQQFLNVPMECAEQFDSPNPTLSLPELSDGRNLESRSSEAMDGALGQRPSSSEADLEKGSLDDVENGNANQGDKYLPKQQLPISMDQKTCRRLSRDDSEQLDNSSRERSRDGSFADMDDAVDTSSKSDDVQLPGNLQPAPGVLRSDQRPLVVQPPSGQLSGNLIPTRSDARPLILGDMKSGASCSKRIPTKPSQKRMAKTTAEKKLKKKRKVPPTCRDEAQLNADASMETSSEEESDS